MNLEREKKLFDAITGIRDDLIEEAQDTKPRTIRPKWQVWSTIAACAILVVGLGGILFWQNLFPFGASPGDGGKVGSGGSGHSEGSTLFMSYAGPVFPLTLDGANNEITAERHISYDFSLAGEEALRAWGAQVQDKYVLSNHLEKEQRITALYPFTGSFHELTKQQPDIMIDGEWIQPTLRPGSYSGGFMGVIGADDPGGSANLKQLNSWEDYKELLKDGSYQQNALSPYPELNQKITVYEFSDFEAPLEEYQAATQAISFTIDQNKTILLQYGFEGMGWEDNGFRQYSYFVPDGISMRPDRKLLIVIGEDISDYNLEGYKNGACERGNELDGVSATVTRYQSVLGDVMDELVTDYFMQYKDGTDLPTDISRELFIGAVAELLYQHGSFSHAVTDRYQDGRLLDIISETNVLKRVLYLEFPVTIPAGESVTLTARLHKSPSFDFACTGSENIGIQGYDMVSHLGSNLHFEGLTAELTNTEHIEIVRQNFGIDLSNNVTKVTLNPATEHYYLEIRKREQNE